MGPFGARGFVEEGGRGTFGSTAEQVEKAAVVSLLAQDAPQQAIEYALSVLGSPNVPGQQGIGQALIAFLCRPSGPCWPNGSVQHALDAAWNTLDDSRFAREGAVQLVSFTPEDAPPGASPRQWADLTAKAQEILDTH